MCCIRSIVALRFVNHCHHTSRAGASWKSVEKTHHIREKASNCPCWSYSPSGGQPARLPTPRVARLLKYLAELEYDKPLDRVELLTVCEMAEILGVTQESVSRILATFKRRAILQKQ